MSKLTLDEVRFSTIDGRPCVALGEECLVVYGEWRQNTGLWRFRLDDLRSPPIRGSSWLTLDSPDDLIAKRRSSAIRTQIGAEWENWQEVLDWSAREILRARQIIFRVPKSIQVVLIPSTLYCI